ncbi:MAG: hypothetical protein Q9225_000043 [Loekoesia sp. 1 TL-2023]
MWSSVRSRAGRGTREDKLTPEPEPETPPKINLQPIGPAPKLDMDIPSSSLRDSPEDDDVTTPPVALNEVSTRRFSPPATTGPRFRPQQLWPSPHMHLRGLSIAKENYLPSAKAPDIINERQPPPAWKEASQEALDPSVPTVPQDAAAEARENKPETNKDYRAREQSFREDTGYISDTESNTGTSITNASTTRTSVSRPRSLIKVAYDSSWALESAVQSNEDFRGTFWPAAKVIKSSKRSSRSSTGNGPCSSVTEASHGRVNRSTDPTMPHPTSDPSSEQDLDEQTSEVSTITARVENSRLASESYEADTEANTSSPKMASMGSRAAWEEARADRAKRYAALQLEMDTSTDEDSEFGVELTASPSLRYAQVPVGEVDEQINLSHEKGLTPQNGRKAFTLRSSPPANTLRASGELDLHMSAPFKPECSSSMSQNTRATPVVPIDEYLDDKFLRHRLLDGNTDFILGETLNGQDASTSEDRFLVTSQLNPEDPFDAALASFGCPERTLCQPFNQIVGDTTSRDRFQSDSPQSDRTTDSCAVTTHDPACFVPPPFPNLHVRSKPVRQTSGLINEIRRDLIFEQRTKDRSGEAEVEATDAMTPSPDPRQTNDATARQDDEVSPGKESMTPSPFEDVPATFSDGWTRPITQNRSSKSLDLAAANGIAHDVSLPSLKDLESRTSRLSVSEKSSAESLDTSLQHRRGRSRRRSSSSAAQSRKARALGRLSSRGYRKFSLTRSYTSASGQDSQSRTPSFASTSTNGSFDQREWLEAHYKRLEEQIARDSARDQPKEPRQRLADVSMVKRREELNKKASIEALCQFIYQCEQESEAEEAKESQEDAEDGYTTAMFQSK